jgi:glucosyl-3-phosphoglycerate synthase
MDERTPAEFTRSAASDDGDHWGLRPQVHSWLRRRSSRAADWPLARLMAAKSGTSISVVVPARDEESTVGSIVRVIRRRLMREVPLVDELVVVDSCSTDGTARVAAAAGARVVCQNEPLGHLPAMAEQGGGKGAALWKGLAATSGDLVAFVDADVYGFTPEFVTGLLGPLLLDPTVSYVKGFYHRPLVDGDRTVADGGGRVTELVARPLLNLHWPELAGFVQPLAGEYAGRREALEAVPFVTGYGVEVGLLIDLLELVGLDALAQVDLGRRQHKHQDNEGLGRMAAQIMLAVLSRLDRQRQVIITSAPSPRLAQFRRGDACVSGVSGISGVEREVVVADVAVPERPPLARVRAGQDGQLSRVRPA